MTEQKRYTSLSYHCRACNHGYSATRVHDGTSAEFKTEPHYCLDGQIVPGLIVNVWSPAKKIKKS